MFSLSKINQQQFVGGGKKVTLIIRQLATLLDAGIPLLRGLETLVKQESNPQNQALLETIALSVRNGRCFSDTAAGFPAVFNPLFISMMRAGEAGGNLSVVLMQLAEFREKSMETKSRVIHAMIYPVIVMIVAMLIVGLLMIYVVPQFEGIYGDMLKGQRLPVLTRWVVDSSRLLSSHFTFVVSSIVCGWFLFWAFRRSLSGKQLMDTIVYRAPGFRAVAVPLAASRFARTFGTLIGTDVPVLQALCIARDVVGNRLAMKALDSVHDRVRDGESIAIPLAQTRVFPEMVPGMIEVGEETGRLKDMCDRVADNYERELEKVVLGFTAILEPILIVLLALVIGTIVIALFLPMVGILENLG